VNNVISVGNLAADLKNYQGNNDEFSKELNRLRETLLNQTEVTLLQTENNKLAKQELENKLNESLDHKKKEEEKWQKELEQLANELRQLEESQKMSEKTIKEQIEVRKKELEKIQVDLKLSESHVDSERQELSELNNKLQEQKTQLQETQDRIKNEREKLQSEITILSDARQELENSNGEVSNQLKQQLEVLQKLNESLQTQQSENEVKLNEYKIQQQQLEEERNRMLQSLKEESEHVNKLADELSIPDLKKQLEERKSVAKQLESLQKQQMSCELVQKDLTKRLAQQEKNQSEADDLLQQQQDQLLLYRQTIHSSLTKIMESKNLETIETTAMIEGSSAILQSMAKVIFGTDQSHEFADFLAISKELEQEAKAIGEKGLEAYRSDQDQQMNTLRSSKLSLTRQLANCTESLKFVDGQHTIGGRADVQKEDVPLRKLRFLYLQAKEMAEYQTRRAEDLQVSQKQMQQSLGTSLGLDIRDRIALEREADHLQEMRRRLEEEAEKSTPTSLPLSERIAHFLSLYKSLKKECSREGASSSSSDQFIPTRRAPPLPSSSTQTAETGPSAVVATAGAKEAEGTRAAQTQSPTEEDQKDCPEQIARWREDGRERFIFDEAPIACVHTISPEDIIRFDPDELARIPINYLTREQMKALFQAKSPVQHLDLLNLDSGSCSLLTGLANLQSAVGYQSPNACAHVKRVCHFSELHCVQS
jgi:myosin heavy subunit